MKYIALVYSNPGAFEALSPAERDDADARGRRISSRSSPSPGSSSAAPRSPTRPPGRRCGCGTAFRRSRTGRSPRPRSSCAGYFVVDCESVERATEIVARDPAARFWAVEVRPIMDEAGDGDVSAQPGVGVEDLLRALAPQVLGALVRRYGHFDACEDAVQEALLAAALQWPEQGVPDNPRGWLITVASRRLTDELRSDHARRRREETAAALVPPDELVAPAPGRRAVPATRTTR